MDIDFMNAKSKVAQINLQLLHEADRIELLARDLELLEKKYEYERNAVPHTLFLSDPTQYNYIMARSDHNLKILEHLKALLQLLRMEARVTE